ncbi:MAG: SOS response-associated peptidase [Actinomycetota bacterium]|nr:SOS response-associated peptidase [Actinomycetota bacterium]
MCGRFVQVEKPAFYAEHFGAEFVRTETLRGSFNVAPTSQIYAIADHGDERVLTSFRWGLIPSWAKEKTIGARTFNARSETVAEKPMFRSSFTRRRCIIPVDGFYEWERGARGKIPHYIYAADGAPLPAAGLWSAWTDPRTEERLLTCTILTGRPNELVAKIHDRMPVILAPDRWDAWLDPTNNDTEFLRELMGVYPVEMMAAHPVSTLVNKVQNDTGDLIKPLATPADHSG